ncbi:RNA-directed DNA polymerase, eukaryota, reverse transcriptase zinc-binding domain protein [Tanacetum coccineum]
MITWIMECLSSPSFIVSINGDHNGFFKGNRGLRQGDPLSSYLFTLVMDVFSLMLNRRIAEDGRFKFHWRCEKVSLSHLYFANDLMIFSKADKNSVSIIKSAIGEFNNASGLKPNINKSIIFFGNVPGHLKDSILKIMPFSVGSLPIRYLGVPLISARLYKNIILVWWIK